MQFLMIGNLPPDIFKSRRYPDIGRLLEQEKADAIWRTEKCTTVFILSSKCEKLEQNCCGRPHKMA